MGWMLITCRLCWRSASCPGGTIVSHCVRYCCVRYSNGLAVSLLTILFSNSITLGANILYWSSLSLHYICDLLLSLLILLFSSFVMNQNVRLLISFGSCRYMLYYRTDTSCRGASGTHHCYYLLMRRIRFLLCDLWRHLVSFRVCVPYWVDTCCTCQSSLCWCCCDNWLVLARALVP